MAKAVLNKLLSRPNKIRRSQLNDIKPPEQFDRF
jgi:hypothetical protein